MSQERPQPPVPDIRLERYLLEELPAAEMQEMTQRLESDPSLAARLDALRRSNAEILEQHPARVVGRQIESRVARRGFKTTGWPRWWPAPAAALAALLLLSVLPQGIWETETSPTVGSERVKGLEPRLLLYRKTAVGSEELEDGADLEEGDLIRVAYQSVGRPFGMILSVDGRGTVTLHLPQRGTQASRLESDGRVLLDFAYELDDAPRWERFYFVTGDAPFSVDTVVEAARDVRTDRSVDQPDLLALPGELKQFVVSIRKGIEE